jgi:hypothetical protein
MQTSVDPETQYLPDHAVLQTSLSRVPMSSTVEGPAFLVQVPQRLGTCQTSQISVLGLRDIFYEKPQSMLENAGSSVRISVFLGC